MQEGRGAEGRGVPRPFSAGAAPAAGGASAGSARGRQAHVDVWRRPPTSSGWEALGSREWDTAGARLGEGWRGGGGGVQCLVG